jgi:hypothetical protein
MRQGPDQDAGFRLVQPPALGLFRLVMVAAKWNVGASAGGTLDPGVYALDPPAEHARIAAVLYWNGGRLASGAGMVTISERPAEVAASSWRRC